jgi:hypothetical protein
VFYLRDRARLRNAPRGFLEVVYVQPHQVDRTIRRRAKMGYDLHDQRKVEAPGRMVRGGSVQVPVVILTFIKK